MRSMFFCELLDVTDAFYSSPIYTIKRVEERIKKASTCLILQSLKAIFQILTLAVAHIASLMCYVNC